MINVIFSIIISVGGCVGIDLCLYTQLETSAQKRGWYRNTLQRSFFLLNIIVDDHHHHHLKQLLTKL